MESGLFTMVACGGATTKAQAFFAVAVLLPCVTAAVAQESAIAEPYDVDEAYHVYSALLPREESYGSAEGMVVIQQETVTDQHVTGGCLTADAANKFKDAISDFERANRKPWRLQRQFEMQKPYEVMSSDAIKLLFKEHGSDWDGFYERYPSSGGFLVLSAVGFNKDKTLAIVYVGSACGSLCGTWGFHLLEKVDGKWQKAPGITCVTVS
jgi:hypothetical protein